MSTVPTDAELLEHVDAIADALIFDEQAYDQITPAPDLSFDWGGHRRDVFGADYQPGIYDPDQHLYAGELVTPAPVSLTEVFAQIREQLEVAV